MHHVIKTVLDLVVMKEGDEKENRNEYQNLPGGKERPSDA
jgi:hypothetical protein